MHRIKTRVALVGLELGLLLSALLVVTSPVAAGILDATWIAPTTNTDGSPLTDLASYRVYYSTSGSPCPGGSSVSVASPTLRPGPNETVGVRLSGLTTGATYNVSVVAVDASGNPSGCSSMVSAAARADFAVSPTGTVNFGSVSIGSFAERTFTVSNTGGGTLAGTASVPLPFTIVSGGSFTLDATTTTHAVRVRFTPTTATTATANIRFMAGGGTVSGVVTGIGTAAAADTTAPSVTITSPTAGPAFTASGSTLTLGGTASDNVGVTQVTWANNRGGAGTAAGTTSWTAGGIALQLGTNVLTVTARDAAGNTGRAALTVTLPDSTPPTVAVTAPTALATVTGTVTVAASATDTSGVAGVQFRLDGVNLGAEVTTPPYGVPWNTTTVADGAHQLTAVARDPAGNTATSPAVTVTVSNSASDVTGPVISQVTISVTSSRATITWITNEPSDTQIQYGRRSSSTNLTPVDTNLVTRHSQVIEGLAPRTWYHFRARSRDAAGNLTLSRDHRFRTR